MIDDRLLRRVAMLLFVPLLVVACSIPVDDSVNRIDNDRLGNLANTTTTSTTTTTTTTMPATTLEPPDSTAVTVPTTAAPTTAAPQGTQVILYYTISNTESLTRVLAPLPGVDGPSFEQMYNELQNPVVVNLGQQGLQTAVRSGLVIDVVQDGPNATVTLAQEVFETLNDNQKLRAIAQVVLTFTSFATLDDGSIAFVQFMFADGELVPIVLPDTGSLTTDPVTFTDFRSMITGGTGATPDTTQPSEPPTATTSPPE
jgi:hypothetical protein